MAVAPASIAARNAESVFSGATAEAPRWAMFRNLEAGTCVIPYAISVYV